MAGVNFWVKAGAIGGALGVLLGAFGAHGLKKKFPGNDAKVSSWRAAERMQLFHSLLLLVTPTLPRPDLTGWLALTGITLFSGSVYGLVLLRDGHPLRKVLGPTTPLGGLCLAAAWGSILLGE